MYILYSIPSTASCLCRSAIAHPYIYMYVFSFIPLHLCVKGSCEIFRLLVRYYCMVGTRSTSISLHSLTMCMWPIKFDLIWHLILAVICPSNSLSHSLCVISVKFGLELAPEWHSSLRHCISVQEGVTTVPGLNPSFITPGRDWESHRVAHNWKGVGHHCK